MASTFANNEDGRATITDATVFYDLKALRFSAKVDNLTSEKYWAIATMAPMPPARYSFSTAIRF